MVWGAHGILYIRIYIYMLVGGFSPTHLKNYAQVKLDHETPRFRMKIKDLWVATTRLTFYGTRKHIPLAGKFGNSTEKWAKGQCSEKLGESWTLRPWWEVKLQLGSSRLESSMYPKLAAKRHFCGLASLPSHTTALLQCQAAADKKNTCDGVKSNTFAKWSIFQARKTPKPTRKNFIPSEKIGSWNQNPIPSFAVRWIIVTIPNRTHLEFLGFLDFSHPWVHPAVAPHQSISQKQFKVASSFLTVSRFGRLTDGKFTDLTP